MIYTCEHQIQGKRGTIYYILVRNVIRAYFNSSRGPGSTCLKWPSEYQLSKTPFWAYNTLQYFILYRSSCFVLKKLIIRSSRFPSNFGFLSSFVGLTWLVQVFLCVTVNEISICPFAFIQKICPFASPWLDNYPSISLSLSLLSLSSVHISHFFWLLFTSPLLFFLFPLLYNYL